ncbi:MAG: hypothetical protein PF482_07335 [Desulfobacteraceae bacterium]|jgi:thioester reductase-like protein|nr:hypothetical protein [Desulfobacteraceae bacterium]
MLYSGHFSFDEIGTDQTPRHGYFACLVKAENAEQAFKKFKNRILKIREEEKDELFTKMFAVYVEDVVEIPDDFSGEAVVTRYQSSEGPFPRSKSCFLPVSEKAKLKSYLWMPDNVSKEKGNEEYKEAQPFLEF